MLSTCFDQKRMVVFNVLVILYAGLGYINTSEYNPRCLMYFFHIAAELPCL